MMTKGILVASFGTTVDKTRELNITAVENTIAETFKEYKIYSAFTSGMVCKILAKRGIEYFDAATVMQRMAQDGIKDVVIQPTHLLYGDEFDKLCTQAIQNEYLFNSVKFSTPLLADTDDMRRVLHILRDNIALEAGECLVLVGHGTHHFCNPVYAALDYMAKAEGMENIFVGTLESYPDIDMLLNLVQKAGYKKAVLTPLMLVAGDHGINDMASDDEDSWKSQFEKKGIQTRCLVKGLGEYQQIKDIYCSHVVETLGES